MFMRFLVRVYRRRNKMIKTLCCFSGARFTVKFCQLMSIVFVAGLLSYWILDSRTYDIAPVKGWEYNRSRDVSLYIQPENYTSILLPSTFCKHQTDLLVVITSTPQNFNERNAIRETWALKRNLTDFRVDFYFILGEVNNDTLQESLVQEFQEHNDIVQEQFLDTYNNLTLKSLMMLKLVKKHCTLNTRFLMKTDDDMFVNIPVLAKYLKFRRASRELFGSLIKKATPIRQQTSKWRAPPYMYKNSYYPNYLSGTGYVMSIDVALALYKASFTTPIYYLEDVYITGILSEVIKLEPKNHPGFSYQKRGEDICIYMTAITSHHVEESDMRPLYERLRHADFRECRRLAQIKRTKVRRRTESG